MEPIGLFAIISFIVGMGAIAINETTVDKAAVESQGMFKVDDSVYQCNQIQKLGVIPKPKTIILEKEKPCPKCKPVIIEKKRPCGDDKKIFPQCEYSK